MRGAGKRGGLGMGRFSHKKSFQPDAARILNRKNPPHRNLIIALKEGRKNR
jgi:hypothetical protein